MGTSWYAAEYLASTVSKQWNLELTAKVRQLQQEMCILQLVCHQLTDSHIILTTLAGSSKLSALHNVRGYFVDYNNGISCCTTLIILGKHSL